ncbi:REP element-mobilizing transposase RayT [Paenisporosarcina quisquiliarum]|nr:REP element-mobilizing transposase RayT [Paenisporosarcina quisquiliarum]
MTRKRNLNPDSYCHVIMRGNNRLPIFGAHRDMLELMRIFEYAHDQYPFHLLAYCFMTNHYHLLMKTESESLSKIMAHINRRYTSSYSKRYNHVGRIYQSRYFAKEVKSYSGLLAVSIYIHRNPINTKQPLVNRLEWYPYSSYPFYFEESKNAPKFLKRDVLKEYLPHPLEKTNAKYCEFCKKTPVHHTILQNSGGTLKT